MTYSERIDALRDLQAAVLEERQQILKYLRYYAARLSYEDEHDPTAAWLRVMAADIEHGTPLKIEWDGDLPAHVIHLNKADAHAFLSGIENPPEPNKKLMDAFRRLNEER